MKSRLFEILEAARCPGRSPTQDQPVREGHFVVDTRQFGLSARLSTFWMIASNTKMADAVGSIESRMRLPRDQATY